MQARATTWRVPPPDPAPSAFVAYGPLPYWMSVLGDVRDPAVIDVELSLMTLSRHLGALGFTPVVIEGVTEKPSTVEILGRSGEDLVVAVGLYPSPPYAHPYTTGSEWKLGDDPVVIALAPGVHVSVDAGPGRLVAPSARRTVVFRHAL